MTAFTFYTTDGANSLFIPDTIGDAKGDLLVGDAANSFIRKAVGTDGKVLTADSSAAGGVTWGAPTSTPSAHTHTTANEVALSALDIESGTDIGGALADADLIIVDDGAGGTNRKSAISRVWTYVQSKLGFAAKGDLLVGTAANTFTALSVGTDDFVLTADAAETSGLKWSAISSLSDAVPPPVTTRYTSTQTWSQTTDARYYEIEVVGAGGGGAGAPSAAAGQMSLGGGGGYGSRAVARVDAEDLAATESIVIGAAGSAGSGASDGGDGGTTTFGSILSAAGGKGGKYGTATAAPKGVLGGVGGIATLGTFLINGAPGGFAFGSGDDAIGGVGGSGPWGGGGLGGRTNGTGSFPGSAGTGYGSGGGGACVHGSASLAAGGVGRQGAVFVTAYF